MTGLVYTAAYVLQLNINWIWTLYKILCFNVCGRWIGTTFCL